MMLTEPTTLPLDYAACVLWYQYFSQAQANFRFLSPTLNSGRFWQILDKNEQLLLEWRLPLLFPKIHSLGVPLTNLAEEVPNTLIILLKAEGGALAFSYKGKIESHKVIRRYTTRRKQGKAQIYYLKKRGKSKAGSRVRLAQTANLLKAINQKIAEWDIMAETERILVSCPILLWNMLHQASPMFDKHDKRIQKVPWHVPAPSYEALLKINSVAQTGIVKIHNQEDTQFLFQLV